MVKLIRLCESKKILEHQERYNKETKEVWGITTEIISYVDLYYDLGFRNINTWILLPEADIYRISWTPKKAYTINSGLIYYLGILNQKRLLDPYNYQRTSGGKFQQTLFLEHYWFKTPRTLFFFIKENYKQKYISIIEKNIAYPIIIKDPFKDRGKGVFYVKNNKELEKILTDNYDKWLLIQECIENVWEYRVVVVGGKIVACFKRYNPNSYKNNIFKDTIFEEIKLEENKKEEIISLVNKYGIEFAGIDILIGKDNQQYYLEINSEPQFQRAEKVCDQNIIKELMLYIKDIKIDKK